MIRTVVPPGTFPALDLSPPEIAALEAIAQAVVEEALASLHEHVVVQKEVVDPQRWKKIRQRDDVVMYKERKHVRRAQGASKAKYSWEGSSEDPARTPVVLTVGTIGGKLDDIMYGVLNPTTESMHIKSSYTQDGFLDGRVLVPIIKPSRSQPLRSLSLRWVLKGAPLPSMIVRMRDMVYLESTGIALTKSGERIGYQIYHSVDIPGMRELYDYHIIRAKISFCYLYRQTTDQIASVFMKGKLDSFGAVLPSIGVLAASDAVISVWRNVHCAEMKKLMWLLWDSSTQVVELAPRMSEGSAACAICTKRIKLFITANTEKQTCGVCRQRVCPRCSVTHKISFFVDEQVRQSRILFCTGCLKRASAMSAVTVALYDLADLNWARNCSEYMVRFDTVSTTSSSFSSMYY